jgi:L,D-peptidoglycan transpeptidase YkuD (ErfK/YbiS/YcfS/YnhG family)
MENDHGLRCAHGFLHREGTHAVYFVLEIYQLKNEHCAAWRNRMAGDNAFSFRAWRALPGIALVLAAFLYSGAGAESPVPLPESFRSFADSRGGLPALCAQAVIVRARRYGTGEALICALERSRGDWKTVIADTPVVIGAAGFAPDGEKREGDGRTPAGIFTVETAFGSAARVDTRLRYRQATERDFWVDDVRSTQYNTWVSGTPDAASFERMLRDDGLYRLGFVVGYNTAPVVPGRGSAIFFHVWPGPGSVTTGCVAAPERIMAALLKWLDMDRNPVVIMGVF